MEPICVDGIVWVSLDYKFITQNLDYVQKEKKIPVKHLKPELFRMQKKKEALKELILSWLATLQRAACCGLHLPETIYIFMEVPLYV